MPKLEVILGPTSSGKTSYALKRAKEIGGVVMSADSRQIVKHMNVGTGKIPIHVHTEHKIEKGKKKWTIDGIDIWGYDLTDPVTYFSAYDYAKFAIEKINELAENEKYNTIILVGGTGFYIDLVLGNKNVANVIPDFELRTNLENKPLEELSRELMSLNLEVAKKTDLNNKIRVIRAIEILKSSDKDSVLPRLNLQPDTIIGLTAPRPLLYERVDQWVEEIWETLLIETRGLVEGPYGGSDKLRGLVYKTAINQIEGTLTQEEALQRTKYDLHAYIRRQQTYFKKMPNIKWLDLQDF